MLKRALFLLIIISLAACAPHRVSQCPSPQLPASYSRRQHVVKKGDSLWAIANQWEVSVSELMRENHIFSPQDLKEGQIINIPASYKKIENDIFFSWPIKGDVISPFGERINNVVNRGLNIKVKEAEYVRAASTGEVIFCDYLKGWGKTIILKHPHDFYTIYANLTDNPVKEGKSVRTGDSLGKVSKSADGSHILHFEIRKQHLPKDPLGYLQ